MGTDKESEFERLVKLETKLEVLTENLTKAIERLEKKLDDREQNYVTREVLEEKLKSQKNEITGIQAGLNELRQERANNKNSIPGWFQAITGLASLAVAIVAIVVSLK